MESKNKGKGVIMGATNYITISNGQNAKDAFSSAHEQAKWEHGHGGYKDSFVEFPRPKGVHMRTVMDMANRMCSEGEVESLSQLAKKYPKFAVRQMSQVWDDKWGPSVCIELQPKKYVFFGMASE